MMKWFREKSIVKLNFLVSTGFGIFVGILFPFYAAIFVNFKSDLLKFLFCSGCIIAGICVGLLAFLITKFTILRIIKLVANELKEIAAGKGNLDNTIEINSHDEIGDLIHWFNSFLLHFGKIVNSARNNIANSRNIGNTLLERLSGIKDSVNTITGDIQEIRDIQFNQNTMVDSTEMALSTLDDSVLIVVSNIMEFFEQMDTLTSIIISQSHSIEKIITNISLVTDKIGSSEAAVPADENNDSLYFTGTGFIEKTIQLLDKSRGNIANIKEILGDIDGIAINTDLLAIKTSIEAAHAGAAGKGFRIIATEIRKLADDTNTLINNIQEVINKIYMDNTSAEKAIKENQQQYNNTLKDVTDATGDLFHTATGIKTITTEVKENYSAIGQMLIVLKEKMDGLRINSEYCHESMKKLKKITDTIQTRIKDINNLSTKINKHNLEVWEQSLSFGNDLQDLDDQISQYKLSQK